jgi:curved DNA-binding protein CbpA
MSKCHYITTRLYATVKQKTPFEVLSLNTNASTSEIKARYKELAKNLHPDKKPSGDLAKFQELVQAYELLVDPNKRSYYLKSGYGWSTSQAARDTTSTYPPPGHRPSSYTNAYWTSENGATTTADFHERFVKNSTFLSLLAGFVVAIGTVNLIYFQSSHGSVLSAADQHHLKSSDDLKRARTEAKLFGNDRGVKRVIDSRMKEFRSPHNHNWDTSTHIDNPAYASPHHPHKEPQIIVKEI